MNAEYRQTNATDWTFTLVIMLAPIVLLGAWFYLVQTIAQPSDAPSTSTNIDTTPVYHAEDSQGIKSTLSITWSESYPLIYLGQEGRVTDVFVNPADDIQNGDRIFQVEGLDVYAFKSEVPPYRPVNRMATKDEIRAANAFLSKATDTELKGDEWTSGTQQALTMFAKELGIEGQPDAFDPSWVVWHPLDATTVESVSVRKGLFVTPGSEPILELSPRIIEAEVVGPLPSFGEVEIVYRDLSGVVDAEGIASSELVEDLTKALNEDATEIEVEIQSGRSRQAKSVPTSAVITDSHGSTCVFQEQTLADGEVSHVPIGVHIVGGTPGATFVESDEAALEGDVVINPLQIPGPIECDVDQ